MTLGALLGKHHVHFVLEDLKVRLGETVKANQTLLAEGGWVSRKGGWWCQGQYRPQSLANGLIPNNYKSQSNIKRCL